MWWEDWTLRRGGSYPTGRLGWLVKRMHRCFLSPTLYQGCWSSCLRRRKKKIQPTKIYNYVISLFLFKISGWTDIVFVQKIHELEYIVFQNLLFCCSGSLFLVLNELTKTEFMALFSIELKHSWNIAPEIKLLSRAFLHWSFYHDFHLLRRINFPSDVKDVSVISVGVVFLGSNRKTMKFLHCPFSWKSNI